MSSRLDFGHFSWNNHSQSRYSVLYETECSVQSWWNTPCCYAQVLFSQGFKKRCRELKLIVWRTIKHCISFVPFTLTLRRHITWNDSLVCYLRHLVWVIRYWMCSCQELAPAFCFWVEQKQPIEMHRCRHSGTYTDTQTRRRRCTRSHAHGHTQTHTCTDTHDYGHMRTDTNKLDTCVQTHSGTHTHTYVWGLGYLSMVSVIPLQWNVRACCSGVRFQMHSSSVCKARMSSGVVEHSNLAWHLTLN